MSISGEWVSVNPNPYPKTAFFKKKIDPDPNPSFYWHPDKAVWEAGFCQDR